MGFEPTTAGSTIRGSNQLSYVHHRPAAFLCVARPAGLEPATLGLEGRCSIRLSYGRVPSSQRSELVGAEGFEPPTLCSQSRCATRLRHAPPCTDLPSSPRPLPLPARV